MKFKLFGLIAMSALMATACGDKKEDSDKSEEETENVSEKKGDDATPVTTKEVVTNNGDIRLAYILTDSVISSYKGFQEANTTITKKQADFETRAVKLEQSLMARGTKLQKDYESGNYVKLSDLQERQDKLAQDQQSYAQRIQKERMELEDLAQRLIAVQQKDISDFIEKFGEAQNYDMILLKPGGLIYGKKMYDITGEVIDKLNAEYDAGVAKDLELEKVIADTL